LFIPLMRVKNHKHHINRPGTFQDCENKDTTFLCTLNSA
jgi:hypothetical protein